MVYVQRDDDGKIIGVYSNFQSGIAEEELPSDNEEVIAFLNPSITLKDYQHAIQVLIEETAKSKQYDSAANMASYVSSTVSVWAAQAQTFVAWRDAVWQYAFGEYEKFQLGTREQPSVAEFLSELPIIDWG